MSILVLCLAGTKAPGHPGLDEDLARTTVQIAESPGNIDLWMARASLHWLHEDWVAAESDCNKVLELSPSLPKAERLLAQVWMGKGETARAINLLNQHITKHPGEPAAWWTRGTAWRKLNAEEKAARDFCTALDLGALVPLSYYADAIHSLLSQGPTVASEAEWRCRQGLETFKDNAVLLELLQKALLDQRKFDEALAVLDARMLRRPRQEWRLVERARILATAGKQVEARAALADADRLIAALPAHIQATPAVRGLSDSIKQQRLAAQVNAPASYSPNTSSVPNPPIPRR